MQIDLPPLAVAAGVLIALALAVWAGRTSARILFDASRDAPATADAADDQHEEPGGTRRASG